MKKILVVLLILASLVICGCGVQTPSSQSNGSQSFSSQNGSSAPEVVQVGAVQKNNVVVRKVENIPSEELNYQLKSSYMVDNYVIYNFYLGYVENVPLQEITDKNTFYYGGHGNTSQTLSREETTSTALKRISETIIEESTFDNTSVQHSLSVNVGKEIGGTLTASILQATKKFNIGLNVGASRTHNTGSSKTNTTSESVENAESNSISYREEKTYSFDSSSCAAGYYSTNFLGRFDIFTMVVIDLETLTFSISNESILYKSFPSYIYSPTSDFSNYNNVEKLQFNTSYLDNLVIPGATNKVFFNLNKSELLLNPTCSVLSDDMSIKVAYGHSYSLPTPTCEYYKFLGWFDENNNEYKDGIWKLEEDITLYAKWEQEYKDYTYISNAGQFNSISNLSKKYMIIQDIDFSGGELIPLGRNGSSAFTGELNGLGHSIYNFNITSYMTLGSETMSGVVAYNTTGLICDLIVGKTNYTTSIYYETGIPGNSVGAIVGKQDNTGEIRNCSSINVNISTSVGKNWSYQYGGVWNNGGLICGTNRGKINGCRVENGSVYTYGAAYWEHNCESRSGGIVGYHDVGNINNCSVVNSTMSAESGHSGNLANHKGWAHSMAGGIIGQLKGGNYSSCGIDCNVINVGRNQYGTDKWGDYAGYRDDAYVGAH